MAKNRRNCKFSVLLLLALMGLLAAGCAPAPVSETPSSSSSPSLPTSTISPSGTPPSETKVPQTPPSTVSPSETPVTQTPSFPIEGMREDEGGWIHLQIGGDPYKMGFQQGALLAKEIAENIRVQDHVLKYQTGSDFQYFKEKAVEFYGELVPFELEEEMQGIADGARIKGVEISYEDILALNSLIDLYSWWEIEESGQALRTHHCSAFIATGDWTSDGKMVIAHNTWGSYADFAPWNLILDIQPKEGHRIVMQSAPGLIWSGSDFFITDAGLAGCETTLFNFQRFDPKGIPAFLRSRRAMQYADSLEDFVSLMSEGNNGGYPNAWLLGDIKTNEIARFEQGLEFTSFQKKENGYFAGYNAAEDPNIQGECGGWTSDDPSNFSGARKVRFQELMEEYKGKIDTEVAKVILQDHYDTWLKEENPSSRTICGHYEYKGAPSGAMDSKVTTSGLASGMHLWAFWGAPCGTPFSAEALTQNPQYQWLEGVLKDLPSGQWTLF